MELLISQKNDIFDLITEAGLNPKNFIFSTELLGNGVGTVLRYSATEYYFKFFPARFGFIGKYSPGDEKLIDDVDMNRGGWKQFSTRVKRWLTYLKRELNIVNKWDLFTKEIELVTFSFNNDAKNHYFAVDELKIISSKIDILKNEFSKLALSNENIKLLNEKLDNLNEKAEKLMKIDWKELFIGSMMSTIFALSITPSTAKIIWNLIAEVFNQYFLP